MDIDVYIGMIVLFPYTFAPQAEYWAPCNGQLLPMVENQALFNLIGNQFGGDGHYTFALPKLAGPAPGLNYYIALQGVFPPRD